MIRAVIRETGNLARELEGLVGDNEAALAPGPARPPHRDSRAPQQRAQPGDVSLTYAAPYAREFTNVGGTGRWFDASLKFPRGFALCSTNDSTDPLRGLLDPLLSALNSAANDSDAPVPPAGSGHVVAARGQASRARHLRTEPAVKKILVTSVIALLVLAGLAVLVPSLDEDRPGLTVMFPSTTSLYEGAQVKVLGVRVGTVESIEVEGTQVRVSMTYDPDVKIPADVHAVIVPPSVVGDRFVQLTPAYTGGEVLADGATLGIERSGVPLELDDTYRALDQVAGGARSAAARTTRTARCPA